MAGRKINNLPSKVTVETTDEFVGIDNTGNEGARFTASNLYASSISADANNELVIGADSKLYTASPVQSVFGRTGAVVATSGDYTASQVTNAFDTTSNTTDDVTEGSTNLYNRVPAGGTAGQVLQKIDGADYNAEWASATVNDASTTVKGVVEIATDTEVTAETATGGTGASLVATPANMKKHQGVAKAWVRFNATGTLSVSDSYNVSSVTDLGVGLYRVNFSTAMVNSNYSVATSLASTSVVNSTSLQPTSILTSSVTVYAVIATFSSVDAEHNSVIIFGD